MSELPPPPEGMVLTHFIVSDDVERSRRFYTEVLGGRVAFPGEPVNVALANSWIVIASFGQSAPGRGVGRVSWAGWAGTAVHRAGPRHYATDRGSVAEGLTFADVRDFDGDSRFH